MNTLEQTIGNTPLVKLQRLGPDNGSEVWVKLEGNNPAGSVKDRAALSMIVEAEKRGEIQPGDVLIEATSGNTGIALAMIAALKGYRMKLLMPDNMSQERRAAMRAYGAELILVSKEQGMEGARDLALEMAQRGEGKLLDQFNNPDNPYAHYTTTGPEIWQQTAGRITHFVSSMGTTGTITGVSRFLREQSKPVTIVGLQPEEGSSIPGIRRWPAEYMPGIFNASLVDTVLDIHQQDAENTMRQLAVREGIFCGVSSGGAVAGALRIARENPGAVVVAIVCDRGDRYLSTGVFGEEHFSQGGGHLIIKQVGAVGVIDGAQPAFALLLKDIGGASRNLGYPVRRRDIQPGLHNHQRIAAAFNNLHFPLSHHQSVLEIVGNGDKGFADILFPSDHHARFDDQRGVFCVITHQGIVIFLRDSAIAGFNDRFQCRVRVMHLWCSLL